ncbi:MAG TPA: membrane dipeptidase [Myxococcota bacterium]|jgi:microsomal dipeptidase-like Zn-dependent dipeptidase
MSGLGRKLGLLLALLLLAFFGVGRVVERFLNRLDPVALPEVSPAARALHASSLVADMHADSLLTGRDLLARSSVGHVDLPRLQEGGVGLQFFTAATVVPLGLNIERNESDAFDLLTLLGLAQISPFAWRGPLGRAELQADRLEKTIAGSGGALVLVRTRADLDALLLRRAQSGKPIGALLGIEGAHALEGDLANLDVVVARGFRMIGLTHFFDNEFAGSAHGARKGGLTELGRALVRGMEERGVLIDLAHVSPAAIDEVLAMATRPTVVSHGGVKGTCPSERTLSDEHVRAIAAGGGVIGIGYWETAVCGREPRQVVAAMRHVVSLVGDDHVGLGSDYDGATTVGFDTSQLAALTQQLLEDGFPEASIRKILGGNVVRVLREVLPER